MLFFFIPILIAYVMVLWIIISVLINTYLIPILGFDETSNISIGWWVVIVIIISCLYFMIFTKKVESKKFKKYLQFKKN